MSPPSRNQVISVPKRRPPRPHSCKRSRSPARHLAAAKPSQETKANSATKTVRAVQFTSATAVLPRKSLWFSCWVFWLLSLLCCAPRGSERRAPLLVFGREIDDRGQDAADDHPEQLVPVEKRHADEGGINSVIGRHPEQKYELHHEEQIPPAPQRTLRALAVHFSPPPFRPVWSCWALLSHTIAAASGQIKTKRCRSAAVRSFSPCAGRRLG